ncbi:unnamed protein product [marine sediment metagenome]|uniref:Uncharacterized protein n=1 Tax=marine sediment metagenome TaxID=412755 RepID=X0ZM48_9ZZZZ
MNYSLTKEANKGCFYEINEEDILGNNKVKVYLVETNIDIYNDIVRVMVNKLKENNQKGIITSFISPKAQQVNTIDLPGSLSSKYSSILMVIRFLQLIFSVLQILANLLY